MCVCVCVCVVSRERERERERNTDHCVRTPCKTVTEDDGSCLQRVRLHECAYVNLSVCVCECTFVCVKECVCMCAKRDRESQRES